MLVSCWCVACWVWDLLLGLRLPAGLAFNFYIVSYLLSLHLIAEAAFCFLHMYLLSRAVSCLLGLVFCFLGVVYCFLYLCLVLLVCTLFPELVSYFLGSWSLQWSSADFDFYFLNLCLTFSPAVLPPMCMSHFLILLFFFQASGFMGVCHAF